MCLSSISNYLAFHVCFIETIVVEEPFKSKVFKKTVFVVSDTKMHHKLWLNMTLIKLKAKLRERKQNEMSKLIIYPKL